MSADRTPSDQEQQYINEKGQLVVVPARRHQKPPALGNIVDGLLLVFEINLPDSQWYNAAKSLHMQLALSGPLVSQGPYETPEITLANGEEAGTNRRRLQAALESVDYDPALICTIQHHVREKFRGEWDPSTLTAVHRWLVAEHSLSPEDAWKVTAPELLAYLRGAKSDQAKTVPTSPTASDAPMVYLGDRNYAVYDQIQVVEEVEHDVLQAFFGKAGAKASWIVMDKQKLIQTSYLERAPRILKNIQKKYPILAPAIIAPVKRADAG